MAIPQEFCVENQFSLEAFMKLHDEDLTKAAELFLSLKKDVQDEKAVIGKIVKGLKSKGLLGAFDSEYKRVFEERKQEKLSELLEKKATFINSISESQTRIDESKKRVELSKERVAQSKEIVRQAHDELVENLATIIKKGATRIKAN